MNPKKKQPRTERYGVKLFTFQVGLFFPVFQSASATIADFVLADAVNRGVINATHTALR